MFERATSYEIRHEGGRVIAIFPWALDLPGPLAKSSAEEEATLFMAASELLAAGKFVLESIDTRMKTRSPEPEFLRMLKDRVLPAVDLAEGWR